MLISFLVINWILMSIGFALGAWWKAANCEREIEEAYQRGLNLKDKYTR